MGTGRVLEARKIVVMVISVLVSSAIVVPLANGDIIASGNIMLSYNVTSPPIIVNETNSSYQGATFVFNTTIVNGTTVATLQVHLNFKLNGTVQFTTLLLNVLQVFNQGNISGNMTVKILKTAQAGGNKTLNSTFTNALNVYINHNYQTASDLGLLLLNDTVYQISLYPFSGATPMYYIGMNYTEPPLPPTGTDINSIQQLVDFTFTVVS